MDPQSSSELQGGCSRVDAPTEGPDTNSLAPLDLHLKSLTSARVSLARTGVSLTTRDTLSFAVDHAQARDAVYATLSVPTLRAELNARALPAVFVRSAAKDRRTYLRRPDLGRTLSTASEAALAQAIGSHLEPEACRLPRLVIVLSDGLSALAVDRHAISVLDALLPLIEPEWTLVRVVVAEQARVALGDQIGAALKADLALVLIGERPGLAAADSLGAYITWAPRSGRSNAERNCISNIRGGGLSAHDAARRVAFYLREAQRLQGTGTALKDPEALPELQSDPALD